MRTKTPGIIAVSVIALGAVSPAFAQGASGTAMAGTDLNLRAGPGPKAEIVDVIAAEDEVQLMGCLEDSNWCQVSYNGTEGWAFGDYLQTDVEGETVAVYPNRQKIDVETVTYEGDSDVTAAGVAGAAGAAAGAILGGPAAIAAGAVAGAVGGTASSPDDKTVTYVQENPVEPTYLQGEAVVGASVPEDVELQTIPDNDQYSYLNVNGQPVIVAADNHKIVKIIR